MRSVMNSKAAAFYRIARLATYRRDKTAKIYSPERCGVSQSQNSLISEVESAIASGSPDKRVDALRRITDLFMVRADNYSDDQVEVFDGVISLLAGQIETKARAELARRLAPVSRAPVAVIRALARDQSIDVAAPVLSQSPRLTEEDLLGVAQSQGQDRLLAISQRSTVSEAVSYVLVTRGDQGNGRPARSVATVAALIENGAGGDGSRFGSASASVCSKCVSMLKK